METSQNKFEQFFARNVVTKEVHPFSAMLSKKIFVPIDMYLKWYFFTCAWAIIVLICVWFMSIVTIGGIWDLFRVFGSLLLAVAHCLLVWWLVLESRTAYRLLVVIPLAIAHGLREHSSSLLTVSVISIVDRSVDMLVCTSVTVVLFVCSIGIIGFLLGCE